MTDQPQSPPKQDAPPESGNTEKVSIDLGDIQSRLAGMIKEIDQLNQLSPSFGLVMSKLDLVKSAAWFNSYVIEMKQRAMDEKNKSRIVTP